MQSHCIHKTICLVAGLCSLWIVLIENNLWTGQKQLWALPAREPSLFMYPHCRTLYPCQVFGGLWKPFPHIPLSLSLLLSKPFPMIMVFHPWWCFEWLALSLAAIWYSTVLHKSFVFLYAESMACRIKLVPLFRGVTTPSYTSTNQFHYEHELISPGVPHQRSNGRREVTGSKSNPISLHPFPCLPFTSKVPPRAALSCRATDNICRTIGMEDHISSSLPPCLSFLLFHLIPLNVLDKHCPTNESEFIRPILLWW